MALPLSALVPLEIGWDLPSTPRRVGWQVAPPPIREALGVQVSPLARRFDSPVVALVGPDLCPVGRGQWRGRRSILLHLLQRSAKVPGGLVVMSRSGLSASLPDESWQHLRPASPAMGPARARRSSDATGPPCQRCNVVSWIPCLRCVPGWTSRWDPCQRFNSPS